MLYEVITVLFDLLHADGLIPFTRRPVGDHGAGGITEIHLSGQGGLGHAGHADDVAAVPLQPNDFRRRFQSWSLGGAVGTAGDRMDAAAAPGSRASADLARDARSHGLQAVV